MPTIFVDGSFFSENEIAISINNRSFLFGHGVYTTTKVVEGKVYFLKHHLDRLRTHSSNINIDFPEFKTEWLELLLEKNNAFTGIWRLNFIVSRRETETMNFAKTCYGYIAIKLSPYEVTFSRTLTIYPEPIIKPTSRIKSLGVLDRFLVKQHAHSCNCDDALVLSPEGFVLETSFANVFFRHENTIYIPDFSLPLLKGITITNFIQILELLQYKINLCKFRLGDIPESAQFFICNSLSELNPITKIENRAFERDLKFEHLLMEYYQKLTKEQLVDFSSKIVHLF